MGFGLSATNRASIPDLHLKFYIAYIAQCKDRKTMQDEIRGSGGVRWTGQVNVSETNKESLCIVGIF